MCGRHLAAADFVITVRVKFRVPEKYADSFQTLHVHDVEMSSEDVREGGAKHAGSPANAKGRTCWRSTAHQI